MLWDALEGGKNGYSPAPIQYPEVFRNELLRYGQGCRVPLSVNPTIPVTAPFPRQVLFVLYLRPFPPAMEAIVASIFFNFKINLLPVSISQSSLKIPQGRIDMRFQFLLFTVREFRKKINSRHRFHPVDSYCIIHKRIITLFIRKNKSDTL